MNPTLPFAALAATMATAPALPLYQSIEIDKRGMASSWPAGIILGDVAPDDAGMYLKRIGDAVTGVTEWDQAGTLVDGNGNPTYVSDYSLEQLRTYLSGLTSSHGPIRPIEIDAHSTGNADIPRHDGTGQPDIENRWLFVSSGVTAGDTGQPGSLIHTAASSSRNNGSDVYSYYYEGSVGLTSEIAGNTILEFSNDSFGLPFNATEEVLALDYGAGFVTLDPNLNAAGMFTNNHAYYFSVSKAWADDYADIDFVEDPSSPGNYIGPHAATVYRLVVNRESPGPFDFSVYRTWEELGFEASGDLDALDVDPRPAHQTMLFSGVLGSLYHGSTDIAESSQIMIFQTEPNPADARSVPLMDSGQRVSDRMGMVAESSSSTGLPPTNSDALGSGDPEHLLSSNSRLGVPVGYDPSIPNLFGLSASVGATGETIPNNPTMFKEELVLQVSPPTSIGLSFMDSAEPGPTASMPFHRVDFYSLRLPAGVSPADMATFEVDGVLRSTAAGLNFQPTHLGHTRRYTNTPVTEFRMDWPSDVLTERLYIFAVMKYQRNRIGASWLVEIRG